MTAIFSLSRRSKDLNRYELEHGHYAMMQPGFLKRLRAMLVDFASKHRPSKPRYNVFISFKRDPDLQRASDLADTLKAHQLAVSIFTKSLKRTALVQNMGDDIAIRKYVLNRLAVSSAVVLVASASSFSSTWVLEEFSWAMRSSDLTLMVVTDESQPQSLVSSDSLLYWITLRSPFYTVHAEDGHSQAAERIVTVLHTLPTKSKKVQLDIAAAGVANAIAVGIILCIFMASGHMVTLSELPWIIIYLASALLSACVIPCRNRVSIDELARQGFTCVFRGSNCDFARLESMILFPLSYYLVSQLSAHSPLIGSIALVCAITLQEFYAILHDWIQMFAIRFHPFRDARALGPIPKKEPFEAEGIE
jgi:hypothetical protein